ncbi:MAG: response regulator [Nitrospira sp.]|nr:response regulator [Nitrospira sp.]
MEGYGKRVLIADDEESVRGLVTTVLEQEGYTVHAAVDGISALAEMKKRRFDAVISDYHMPRLDGEQFLLLTRLLWPEVPVLLLSGDLTELPLTLQKQGTGTLVPKPFDPQRLLQALHESVSRVYAEYPPDLRPLRPPEFDQTLGVECLPTRIIPECRREAVETEARRGFSQVRPT